MSTTAVFAAALATALATGLGALPFVFTRPDRRRLGAANAIASGVMLGAGVGLVVEGGRYDGAVTALGMVVGALFVSLTHTWMDGDRERRLGALRGADARKALLFVVVMTVHSVAEGVGVGAAFGGGAGFGLLIAGAIAIHNVPEGLAISLVLVPRGVGVRAAAGWSIFSSLPQPLMAVPAYLFVEQFHAVLPAGLGFAAGAMVWMVGRELLPEALAQAPARLVAAAVAASCAAMVALQLALL